jgi:xylulose-5-phosphate/fructose-6-phosphate phosphoketolase
MPGQQIAQANPPPDPSHLPDSLLDLRVTLDTQNVLSPDEVENIKKFRRAADYIAVGNVHTHPTPTFQHTHSYPRQR